MRVAILFFFVLFNTELASHERKLLTSKDGTERALRSFASATPLVTPMSQPPSAEPPLKRYLRHHLMRQGKDAVASQPAATEFGGPNVTVMKSIRVMESAAPHSIDATAEASQSAVTPDPAGSLANTASTSPEFADGGQRGVGAAWKQAERKRRAAQQPRRLRAPPRQASASPRSASRSPSRSVASDELDRAALLGGGVAGGADRQEGPIYVELSPDKPPDEEHASNVFEGEFDQEEGVEDEEESEEEEEEELEENDRDEQGEDAEEAGEEVAQPVRGLRCLLRLPRTSAGPSVVETCAAAADLDGSSAKGAGPALVTPATEREFQELIKPNKTLAGMGSKTRTASKTSTSKASSSKEGAKNPDQSHPPLPQPRQPESQGADPFIGNDQWQRTWDARNRSAGAAPKRATKNSFESSVPTQAGAAASPSVESADMPPGVAMLIRELREQLKEQKSLVKELLAIMSQGAAAASQSQSPADTPQTAKSKARRQIPRDGREEEQDAEIRESKKRKSNGDPDDGGDGDDDDFDGSGDDEDDDQDDDEALSSVSESPSRGRSATRSSGRQERSKIKPLTNKQLCPPEKYCHKSGDVVFKTWRESFRALIDAQGDGVDWEEVLDYVECKKGTIIDSTVVTEIQRHFKWDKSELKVVMSNLYHMLQQFTKGRTQLKMTTARKRNVFDQWRVLYYDGMAVSETALRSGTDPG